MQPFPHSHRQTITMLRVVVTIPHYIYLSSAFLFLNVSTNFFYSLSQHSHAFLLSKYSSPLHVSASKLVHHTLVSLFLFHMFSISIGLGLILHLYCFQVDMNFMKKIPPGAEASNVLVGEVDFLEKPIIAFVRLSPAVLITGLTEVPVPTR